MNKQKKQYEQILIQKELKVVHCPKCSSALVLENLNQIQQIIVCSNKNVSKIILNKLIS